MDVSDPDPDPDLRESLSTIALVGNYPPREYGIYGGESGGLILNLPDHLNMPVVMSDLPREFLREVYDVPDARIVRIPHGSTDLSFVDPAFYKDQVNVEGRRVVLTFGLLSPSKGIEYVIDSMPEIVRQNPDAVYIVLGKTHPKVLRDHDEAYRASLQQKVRKPGPENHVIFHNEFVSLETLTELLDFARDEGHIGVALELFDRALPVSSRGVMRHQEKAMRRSLQPSTVEAGRNS